MDATLNIFLFVSFDFNEQDGSLPSVFLEEDSEGWEAVHSLPIYFFRVL